MPNELHKAAAKNAVEEIEKIIKANFESIKQPDSERQMLPIAWAVFRGHFEAFKLLLDNGSPVDEVDFKEKFPLIYFACSGGNIEIVKLLLKLGHKLTVRTVAGYTTMHAAAFAGRDKMMEFLNENGIPYNVQTNDGKTPMYNAALGDQVDTMKLLHQHGLPYELPWKSGEKVQKFLQELAKTSPNLQQKSPASVTTINLQQKDRPVTPASKPTPAVAAQTPSPTIPNATPRSIPFTTELSLGAKPVVVSQKPPDSILSSLHERLDKLRNERVTPPNKKSTPAPQKLLSQNPRLSSFPQRIDALRSNQTATLAERVAMLEAEKQNQQSIITRQQEEIDALKAEFKKLKDLLTQQQTSTASRDLSPQRPWTPTHFHPVSSTSSSAPERSTPDVEFLGSNPDENLRRLSFAAAIKTEPTEEPTEMDKDLHSGKKHPIGKGAEMSASKREKRTVDKDDKDKDPEMFTAKRHNR